MRACIKGRRLRAGLQLLKVRMEGWGKLQDSKDSFAAQLKRRQADAKKSEIF